MVSLPQTSSWSEVHVALAAGIHSFCSVGGLRSFRLRRAADSAVVSLQPSTVQVPPDGDYYQDFSVYMVAGDAIDSIDGQAGSQYSAPASLAGVRLGDEL